MSTLAFPALGLDQQRTRTVRIWLLKTDGARIASHCAGVDWALLCFTRMIWIKFNGCNLSVIDDDDLSVTIILDLHDLLDESRCVQVQELQTYTDSDSNL